MEIDVSRIPIYIDGSDGSMWEDPAWQWPLFIKGERASRGRFIRLGDFLRACRGSGIEIIYDEQRKKT